MPEGNIIVSSEGLIVVCLEGGTMLVCLLKASQLYDLRPQAGGGGRQISNARCAPLLCFYSVQIEPLRLSISLS
jgi:hypothetical protein